MSIDILDRLTELEHEANSIIEMMHRLKDAYACGYRQVDENDELVTGGDNVHNIAEAVRK